MKKTLGTLLVATTIMVMSFQSNAQEATATHEPGNRAQTVYVELGGPGFISANYDFRFNETRNAWGMRAGMGYFSIEDESMFTVPVQVNYLLGKEGNYFEIGGGASYVSVKYHDSYFIEPGTDREQTSRVMGTMTFGYRKQPVDGGFNFRAGLSPIIMEGSFIPYLPYVSFGYSF